VLTAGASVDVGDVLFWDHSLELAQSDPLHPTVDDALRAGTARRVAGSIDELVDGLVPR
jgi:hypothetical protein